jgi:hypothetical protein
MSIIKVALDKEAAGILKAIKNVGKAISSTYKSNINAAKQKIKGAKSGFKHGNIADFALEQSSKNKKKGEIIRDLKDKLSNITKQHSSEALAGQKQQAEFYNKKIKHLKYGLGLSATTGALGLAANFKLKHDLDKAKGKK